jgi:lipoprotein-anchoring transpeptidase ErfK/SrfK
LDVHQPGQTDHSDRETEASKRGCLPKVFLAALLSVLAGVAVFSAWVVQQAVLAPYETRIYPNVCVLEENLGGLTPSEASERLDMVFASRNAGDLILSDGDQIWQAPWSEAGMHLDANATAQQAFAAGRGQGWRTLLSMWLGERRDIAPVFTIDAEATRRALEQLAVEMHEPPTDATLGLEGDQVFTTPSQPGRELDVEATVEKIVNTVTHVGPDYPFAPTWRAIPPRIPDVSGVKAEAEDMLNREIHVTAQGENEGQMFSWNWTLGRDTIFSWLRVEEIEDNPGFALRIDEEAVRTTVEGLAEEPKSDDWGFPTEKTSQQVLDAFEAGGGEVAVELTPPPRIYVVQSGDTLTRIGAQFGMPPGLIAEVNQDIDLDHLTIGQELIIPHQDVLWPYDPVPGKKIVISIAEQRLRVYENGQLLHDWPCSTGLKESPTYSGEFQILSKEEMAYASQWDLQMPHFLGVYRAGGDTYNGIHALPILANGQRLWAGHLGAPASFGCIVLGIEEAETLFNWAELGVPVVIE